MVLSTTEKDILTGIPIPQADDLNKVFATVELVAEGVETSGEIAAHLDIVERQGLFYLDAARSLRLLGEYTKPGTGGSGGRFYLTGPGRAYVHGHGDRERKMRQAVLTSPVMRYVAGHIGVIRDGHAVPWPPPEELLDVTAVAPAFEDLGVNSTTALRRAYTIRAWLKTLLEAAG